MGALLSRSTQCPEVRGKDNEPSRKRRRLELRDGGRTVFKAFESRASASAAVPLRWEPSSAPAQHDEAAGRAGAERLCRHAALAIESFATVQLNEAAKTDGIAHELKTKAVQAAMRITSVAMAEAISVRREAEQVAAERIENNQLEAQYAQQQARQDAAAIRWEAEAVACELRQAAEAEADTIHKCYERPMRPQPPPPSLGLMPHVSPAATCTPDATAMSSMFAPGGMDVSLAMNSKLGVAATCSALMPSALATASILTGSGSYTAAVPTPLSGATPVRGVAYRGPPPALGNDLGCCFLMPPSMTPTPPLRGSLGGVGFALGGTPSEAQSGDRRPFRKARRPQR